MKVASRRILDIKNIKSEKSDFLTLNVVFQEIVISTINVIFLLQMFSFLSFRIFCEIVLFCVCWNFDYQEKWASMPIISKTAQLE